MRPGRFLHIHCIILLFCSFAFYSNSQCDFEPSSKTLKLLEQSRDTKKYDSDERFGFLEKALEEEPNCLPCLQKIGELEFLRAKRAGSSFEPAKARLEKLVELCEEFHSEPYYYLGAMAYADGEYTQATKYFDKFIHFPDDDPTKFEKDYDKKYEEVKEALPTIKEFEEIFSNPFEYNPVKVSGVSSASDDYLPAISPDGEVMFYTRKIFKKAKGDVAGRDVEEFTWSRRPDINAMFDGGEKLPTPFNTGDNYGGATVSVDNKEMIIAKKNPVAKNPQNIDLFSTRYELGDDPNTGQKVYRWTELQDLGPNVNTDMGWEGQPSLSGDGKHLYFATVRAESIPDGSGNPSHDIYVSERQVDGTWGLAKSIDKLINTPGQEKSPFMHSDSHTLYFSSDGRTGVGKMDIYFTKMQPDGSWSVPKNLGVPVNTEQDEVGLIVSSDGEVAYFGANNFANNRGWDIYQFSLPEKAKPEKVMLLKGEIKNESGEPTPDAIVELKYTESNEVQKVTVSNDDGRYATIVSLEKKEPVLLTVKGEGIAFNSRIIAQPNEEAAITKLMVETQSVGAGKAFVINDIYYETSKADIKEESKIILDEFALYLADHSSLQIEILGHTDDVGNDEANLALSMERAFEVMNYLTSKGVDSKRIKAQGFGETKPVASNDTEEGRAKNRRTEFVVRRM